MRSAWWEMARRFNSLWVWVTQRPAITRLPRHLPVTITALTEPPDIILAADERLALPEGDKNWHPWAWAGAILLHILALAIALYTREPRLQAPQEAPEGISMVFDRGGQQQSMAPPNATHGMPQPAATPTAPPPPPPPPQPEVSLGLPQNPLAELPMPPPHPAPHPAQQTAPHPRPPLPQHYAMMLNGMSYGSPATLAPAKPSPHRNLNLDLPQTDAQAVMGPELSVKGDIGADWMSALNDWVNRHKYYPQAAAEQGQQGNVEIEFTVDRHGNVTGLHMLSSSGSNFLDLAWLGLFQGVKLPPFPPGTKSDHITVDATMQYELIGP